jgi:hypothetical protein
MNLVVYVFHEMNGRVKAFLENAVFKDETTDFLLVVNNKSIDVTLPSYVRCIKRDNIGYDFGGWSEGILTDDLYKKYAHFIFVNSSVIGPFLPNNHVGNWTDVYINGLKGNVKLFGSTINTSMDPLHKSHVQSYIFSMDKETLEFLIKCEIFSTTNIARTFNDAIEYKEMLMSRKIIDNGWNIGSLLPYTVGVDFTFKTAPPTEYPNMFLDDVMYPQYNNKLWNKHGLVFIKGNRITLKRLVDNTLTDKDTTHSYLELYETLLQSKKETAKNVLEIGIGGNFLQK